MFLSQSQAQPELSSETMPAGSFIEPGTIKQTTAYQQEIPPEVFSQSPKKKTPWPMITVAALLLLSAAVVSSYFFYFKEKWVDDRSPRYFVSAQSVSLRSTKVAGVDNNYVASVPYGAELIVYDYQPDWSHVKYKDKKGFVSSKYILNGTDFNLLNNVLGDATTKETIETNKCRLALLDYLNRVTSDSMERLNWKVFTRPKTVKPNTIYYARLVNSGSRFTDFAFIIKNIQTNDARTVLYNFSDDETPNFITEQYAPPDGVIRKAARNFDNYYFYYQ